MGDVSSGMARFEIRGELARGGRGIIYWAWDHTGKMDVAVKILRDLLDDDAIGRFQNDAALLSSISHKGIAPILDYGVAETAGAKQAYLITPLLVGASLAQSLNREFTPLPHALVISVAAQAAEALDAAHQRGCFHRNLKPSNVFVETNETARLVDFGCGFDDAVAGAATLQTLPYFAPELLLRKPASAASDIYALAATCYFCLTKAHAFSGHNEADLFRAILETQPKPLHHHVPGLPSGLNDVILQALSKDPGRRFSSAAEFATALRASTTRKKPSVVLTAPDPEPIPVFKAEKDASRKEQDLYLLRRFRERSLSHDLGRHRERLRKATLETARLYPGDDLIQALALEIIGNLQQVAPSEAPAEQPPLTRWQELRAKFTSQALGKRTEKFLLSAVCGLVLVAVAATFLRPGTGATSNLVPLDVVTDPQGARITINGQAFGRSNTELELPVGTHLATASLDGYKIGRARFDLAGGSAAKVALKLLPAEPVLRLESELDGAAVTLSGRPFARVGPTSFLLEGMPEGPSTLSVTIRSSNVELPLFLAGRQPPRLSGDFSGRDVLLVVASTHGRRLHIDCNLIGASASVDDGKSRTLGVGGVSFDDLSTGPHRLVIDDGSMRRTLQVGITGDPVMHLFALARPDDERGVIILSSGLEDATVLLNGVKTSRRTHGGVAYIGGLAPGAYSVGVVKEAYETADPVRVQVVAGAESRVQIGLKAVPKPALLQFNALPGTEVFVDGHFAGETAEDGSYRGPVNPGSRRVTLRRGAALSSPMSHVFRPGETFQPGAADLAFTQRSGAVELRPDPSDARLTLRPYGQPDTAARLLLKNTSPLPEGSYVLQASAPNYMLLSVNFSVFAGETTRIPLRLKPLPASLQPATLGIESFDEPGPWSADGTWRVRRGGGFVTYSPAAQAGMYSFAIQPRRNRRLQWFANFTGEKNYCLFRLDRHAFSRQRFQAGRVSESVTRTIPNDPSYPGWFDVRVEVESSRVSTQLKIDGKWITVDEWISEELPFTQGQFGYLIANGAKPSTGEEYAIRDFRFTPASR